MFAIDRRQLLAAIPSCAVAMMASRGALAEARAGEPQRFDFNLLRQRAKSLAAQPYVAPPSPPRIVDRIDFDTVQKLKFRRDRALWADGPGPYPIRMFHVDKYNQYPVRLHLVTGDSAREVIYSARDFAYDRVALAGEFPSDLGYSGFRVMHGPAKDTDWLAFQGATYFRSCGEEDQYGISARGLAVNTALPPAEEFPRFSEFWLAETADDRNAITVFALMDSPSLTGAYRFTALKNRGAIIEVTAELFVRTEIARLGIAPLTSMYWYGENERRQASDWRPEIHDSDGLAIWTGSGEHIWRPLVNPASVCTNSFLDTNPKGFGLMQRDRDFANYQDDGAFYDRRPSLWVEPTGDWGEGAIQLVEIPTRDEVHDNVVAYWLPKARVRAGDALTFSYRLYFQNNEPQPPLNVARVVSTRLGRGGIPGQTAAREHIKRKFVIDFVGGELAAMPARYDIEPKVTASRGRVDNAYVIKVVGTNQWRALFDLSAGGSEPIDLRCYLRLGDKTLSETWLYQYHPEVQLAGK